MEEKVLVKKKQIESKGKYFTKWIINDLKTLLWKTLKQNKKATDLLE